MSDRTTGRVVGYATAGAINPAPPETRSRRRRRVWTWCVYTAVGLAAMFYLLFVGHNRWRVWHHHGIRLPLSASDYECHGWTSGLEPWPWIDRESEAEFSISPRDLPSFLGQFEAYDPDTQTLSPVPPGLAAAREGAIGCASPTGRDWADVRWRRNADGTVRVHIRTLWN